MSPVKTRESSATDKHLSTWCCQHIKKQLLHTDPVETHSKSFFPSQCDYSAYFIVIDIGLYWHIAQGKRVEKSLHR